MTESLVVITFADHRAHEETRDATSGKQASGIAGMCKARAVGTTGHNEVIPAVYRGTYDDGGYKHESEGEGIHLTDCFLEEERT